MGRPLKNTSHVLARLRRQLSSDDDHQMTRRELAKKSGIPERSLQDIEAGKYKLGEETAMRISLATYVDPKSLMRDDDPLLNWIGKPLADGGINFRIDIKAESIHGMAQQVLFNTLWEVAEAKHRSLVLSYAFEQWAETTVRLLDLDKCFSERLTEKLREVLFDPSEIRFRPKNKKLAQEWKTIQKEIREEQIEVFTEKSVDHYNKKGVPLDDAQTDYVFLTSREPAIENLRRRKSNAARA